MSGTLLVTLAAVLAGKFEHVASDKIEICNLEERTLSCSGSEILLMTTAEFGRKEVGRCITETDDFMGCTNDVLPLLDRWCSGRMECTIEVPNEALENSNEACLPILIKYLKFEYTCIPALTACNRNSPNKLTQLHGIISSHVTIEKGCGTTRSPWVISVNTGQTVNMSLIDFSLDGETQSLVTCRHVYGYILERALGINHTICGGKQREGALYSSKTNNVEIYMNSQAPQSNRFLISFEVFGCADLTRPPNAWYKREGSEAVIGCETNDQEWRLTCNGNTWHGSVGNCSAPVRTATGTMRPKSEYEGTRTSSRTVVLLTAIAGGAIVLVVIAIVAGVVYIKKYRLRQETRQMQKTYATVDRTTLAYYRPVTADPATNQQPPPSWDAPLTDKEAGTLTSYPGQCSCATLQSRDSRNTSVGGSLGKQHVYNSIGPD